MWKEWSTLPLSPYLYSSHWMRQQNEIAFLELSISHVYYGELLRKTQEDMNSPAI
jgi:hypothetical protein